MSSLSVVTVSNSSHTAYGIDITTLLPTACGCCVYADPLHLLTAILSTVIVFNTLSRADTLTTCILLFSGLIVRNTFLPAGKVTVGVFLTYMVQTAQL